MNLEKAIKEVKKIKEIFEHLKWHSWINDIKRDVDTDDAIESIDTVLKELNRLQKSEEDLMMEAGKIACEMSLEIDKLKRIIKIKDEYLLLIDMRLYDYDGCNTVESLKELIDEARDYIHKALKNDDESIIYEGMKKKFNILHEEVE